MKKAPNCFQLEAFVQSIGRRGGIRPRDPLHPMQVRYQAALHAEALNYSSGLGLYRQQVADFLQFSAQLRDLCILCQRH